MSPASLTDHPLYRSLSVQGRRAGTALRRVPSKRWRLLVMLLLLFWLAYSLAKAFWLLVPAPELEQPPLAPPPPVSETGGGAAQIDLAAIESAELFGVGGAAPEPEPEPAVLPGIEQEAVDTSLNLQLQGVIASSNQDTAWAIIANGNNQALYRVGDTLPQGNNVSLVKVLDQRVILSNNGRYESLWLYSKEDAQRRAGVSPNIPEEYVEEGPEEESYPEEEYVDTTYDPEAGADTGEDVQAETDAEVRTLPTSAVEQVKSINDVVRFTAARGDDGMVGYRIQPGRDRELFEQAGLQAGDVVTAVNGIALDNPQQIRAVYQELQSAAQAELSIVRDGEPVSVIISLN